MPETKRHGKDRRSEGFVEIMKDDVYTLDHPTTWRRVLSKDPLALTTNKRPLPSAPSDHSLIMQPEDREDLRKVRDCLRSRRSTHDVVVRITKAGERTSVILGIVVVADVETIRQARVSIGRHLRPVPNIETFDDLVQAVGRELLPRVKRSERIATSRRR